MIVVAFCSKCGAITRAPAETFRRVVMDHCLDLHHDQLATGIPFYDLLGYERRVMGTVEGSTP